MPLPTWNNWVLVSMALKMFSFTKFQAVIYNACIIFLHTVFLFGSSVINKHIMWWIPQNYRALRARLSSRGTTCKKLLAQSKCLLIYEENLCLLYLLVSWTRNNITLSGPKLRKRFWNINRSIIILVFISIISNYHQYLLT